MAKIPLMPKAKPGQMIARYARLPNDGPDLCVAWGDGVDRRDRHLIMDALGTRICGMGTPPLYKLLEERGYDLTTLRFSISKKADDSPSQPPGGA